MSRPAEIVIDLNALRSNYRLANALCPCSETLAVVKADAYGHGAAEVALALQNQAPMFAVSCLEEALFLRQTGIKQPLLMLEGCFAVEEYPVAAAQGIELVIHSTEQLDQLLTSELDKPVGVWLKVDTGMHRLGLAVDNVVECFQRLQQARQVKHIVLTSHLASADDLNSGFTEYQLNAFYRLCQALVPLSEKPLTCSIANSAGILAWPQSHADWNRPGIMLYGLSPFAQSHPGADKLKAVMRFSAQVIAIREISQGESVGYGNTWTASRVSRIATIAAGYGDGYPRTAKSGTPVMVRGHRCPLAGRVSMDMLCVDVSDLEQVQVGDPVELWGQDLDANEVAAWAGTSGYELVTRMPKRTRRRVIG